MGSLIVASRDDGSGTTGVTMVRLFVASAHNVGASCHLTYLKAN